MVEQLLTIEQVAARLQLSPRRVRALVRSMPGACIRAGRALRFTERDVTRLLDALRWPSPSASAATSGTRAARFASAARPSSSGNTAQERLDAQMRLLSQQRKKPASERKSLTVLPGGENA